MNSCDALIDQDETDFGKGPILAEFQKLSETANFITDGTVATYDIPIAIIGGNNQPISTPVDVTISVDPSSTATAGVEYNLEKTSYTIKPGDMFVNAQITVDTDNLEPFDAKTLVLRIDSSSQGVSETNKTSIVLQAVCELDLSGFVGDYTATTSRNGATGTAKVELGSKPNSLLITNADARGTDQILAVLSGDVTKPTITYVEGGEAALYVHSTYGNVWATTVAPKNSTYNSCDYSMKLEYKSCVSIGCFAGTTKITLVKK
ncbi:hypothetical protein MWU76_00035 [Gelidibacter sp. F2691]|nr:hypothetical protein [Gelidibacter sp. F2691]